MSGNGDESRRNGDERADDARQRTDPPEEDTDAGEDRRLPDGPRRDDRPAETDPSAAEPPTESGVPRDRSDESEAVAEGRAARARGNDDVAAPSPEPRPTDEVTIDDGIITWFLKTDDGTIVAIRDLLGSVALVLLVGLILFGVSGVWPPMVAVESGSMEPNMERGDMILVVDTDRFTGDDPAGDTGIVTREDGENSGHEKFGEPGDVIIFTPNGNPNDVPVIHRAEYWIEEGENWVENADESNLNVDDCDEAPNCPAPHDGFITKGDANEYYDQLEGPGTGAQTTVVQEDWATGKAMFRIPYLGYVRLGFESIVGSSVTLTESEFLDPDPEPIPFAPTAVGVVGALALTRVQS